ncbi:MAG: ASCH domain-containing protein [Desulfurococcales archaeon]|nr:ASCH domain-containing protein [Desulfurococcales archaeon]
MRVRRQFLGRHIMLKKKYGDMLLSGKKTTTIRVGIVKPRYDTLIVHSGGRPIAIVRIEDVTVKRVSELTDEDARRDGFPDRSTLIEALRKMYGRIGGDEPVTIIRFKLVKRLDNLDSDDPYMGLTPAEIARISLRYLNDKLSDEEKRILRDLTVTGSIRGTAQRLYGDPTRRSKIRATLRRALKLLLQEGILSVKRHPDTRIESGGGDSA